MTPEQRYYYGISATNTPIGIVSGYSNEATIDPVHDAINNLACQYQYDARGRMTGKKVPGAAWMYIYGLRQQFTFKFYQPGNGWRIQNCNFQTNFTNDLDKDQ